MKVLLFLFVFLSALFSASLEEMLKQLQTTPKDQRYKLVNNIKREMAKLNQAQRLEAIRKLKSKLHPTKPNAIQPDMQATMKSKNQKIIKENQSHTDMLEHKMRFNKKMDMEHKKIDNINKGQGHKNKMHGRR